MDDHRSFWTRKVDNAQPQSTAQLAESVLEVSAPSCYYATTSAMHEPQRRVPDVGTAEFLEYFVEIMEDALTRPPSPTFPLRPARWD